MLDIESSALIDLIKNEHASDIPGLSKHLAEVAEECERSGKTAFEVIENFGILTKKQMLDEIILALGGRVAEEIVLDDISTGASGTALESSAFGFGTNGFGF